MKKHPQTGFAHLGILLLALIVAVIALAGYKVSQNHNKKVTSSVAPAATQQAQTINTSSDLNSAQTTLDNENVDGDLNPNSLDSDVQSMY